MLKVGLADMNKTVGVATYNALQKEFGKNTVSFIPTDVTDSTQLVSVLSIWFGLSCVYVAEAHV